MITPYGRALRFIVDRAHKPQQFELAIALTAEIFDLKFAEVRRDVQAEVRFAQQRREEKALR